MVKITGHARSTIYKNIKKLKQDDLKRAPGSGHKRILKGNDRRQVTNCCEKLYFQVLRSPREPRSKDHRRSVAGQFGASSVTLATSYGCLCGREPFLVLSHTKRKRPCAKKTPQRGPQIMVWGGISYHGCTLLKMTTKTIDAIGYIDTLNECLLETVDTIYPNGYVLQQDNACPHVASVTQMWSRDICDCPEVASLLSWPKPHRKGMAGHKTLRRDGQKKYQWLASINEKFEMSCRWIILSHSLMLCLRS